MTMPRKRILHLIDSGGVYGAEQVILNLSECMATGGDFEPVVGCIVQRHDEPNDLFDEAQRRGLQAEKFVVRNSMLALDLPRTAQKMKTLGIDLIHSHGYKPSVFGYLMKRLSGIPVMATCHLWFKGENRPLKMRFMVWLELLFYRKFPVVVGVSEDIREVLVAAGVNRDRTRVFKNGVPVRESGVDGPGSIFLRNSLGVGVDDFVIINTGRLTRQKAQLTIIQAAALLQDMGVPCNFLIVGEGDLHEELVQNIQGLGLIDNVQLLGFRSDIPDLLSVADVFVLSSLDEGMPMSLLEAAAANTPIISTAVGDIPKLITDGESGLLISPQDPKGLADSIVNLRNNPQMGRSLAEKAFKILVENFSSSSMHRQYVKLYEELT